jgi:hypothetical protein
MGTGDSFLRSKASARLTTHLSLVLQVKKDWSYSSISLHVILGVAFNSLSIEHFYLSVQQEFWVPG